jgi:hypothetical protein
VAQPQLGGYPKSRTLHRQRPSMRSIRAAIARERWPWRT